MSNMNSNTNKAEIELLISEMGMSPLSAKEYSDLMGFVGKIIITDAKLVNEYCSTYQKRVADLSNQVTELIMDTHKISDTLNICRSVLHCIDDYHHYKEETTNSSLIRIEYEHTEKEIRSFKRRLNTNLVQLEDNLNSFNSFRDSIQKCSYWICMYILGGKIKLKQVDDLLIAFRNGDLSRIKNYESAVIVMNSQNAFEKKLSSLSTSKALCSQLFASIEMEIKNIQEDISSINSVLNSTIPAFEQERSRIS